MSLPTYKILAILILLIASTNAGLKKKFFKSQTIVEQSPPLIVLNPLAPPPLLLPQSIPVLPGSKFGGFGVVSALNTGLFGGADEDTGSLQGSPLGLGLPGGLGGLGDLYGANDDDYNPAYGPGNGYIPLGTGYPEPADDYSSLSYSLPPAYHGYGLNGLGNGYPLGR